MISTRKFIDRLSSAQGTSACNVLRLVNPVIADETVTVGRDTFTFKASPTEAFEVAIGSDANESKDNLVAALAAEGTEGFEGHVIDNKGVFVWSTKVGDRQVACSETLTGSNSQWANATTYRGSAADQDTTLQRYAAHDFVPFSGEKNAAILPIVLGFVPTVVIVQVRTTATGAQIGWDGDVNIVGKLVHLTTDGATDFTENTTVHVVAFG